MLQLFMEKEHRSNYNNSINKFVNNLIKISLTLYRYKIEDRKNKLK
jgi:hypothetical protein